MKEVRLMGLYELGFVGSLSFFRKNTTSAVLQFFGMYPKKGWKISICPGDLNGLNDLIAHLILSGVNSLLDRCLALATSRLDPPD
ncbi:hypothetical protein J6590_081145 [Homalodisca vitripennis]|nr:hypothetical protein J6590_081145 [Homalodisca vitripennis]